jgi:diguanylate cyclase (GGDEF)-like protein
MATRSGRRQRSGQELATHPHVTATESAGSAELVGWAEPLANASPAPGAARAALAAALDVPPDEINSISEATARRALRRLRGLADTASRLATEAETDDLTGALRRGAGLAALGREVARARRGSESMLCVAFLDVDGLKVVNDTLGHPAGDALLRDVVAVLHERLRAYDLTIRYGGDEFVVVLPGLDTPAAERLFAEVCDRVVTRTAGRSISVGLAALGDGDDAVSLLVRADAALVTQRTARATARGH